MAINFQQVFDRIREIGSGVNARKQDLEARRAFALQILEDWAAKGDELRDKVERTRQSDKNLRCALPVGEPLDFHKGETQSPEQKVTLIAADGSQIVPDRHSQVLFGLINVGAVVISGEDGQAPQVFTDSQLSFDEEVVNWTEGLVALQRDLAERKKLLALSRDYPAPLLTLTDGPLQLWEARESGEVAGYEKALDEYLSVLSQLQEGGVLTAGYVDKPSSNLLVRLLELAATPEEELPSFHNRHRLVGVTDLWLLDQLLKAGERSAIYALEARSKAVYRGSLALYFFYINVGWEGHPKCARVEIPAWVAEDEARIALLHRTLLEQCAIMGASPYPYILHRAHETAVVSFQEKEQIEQMLAVELRRAGGEVGDVSGKQANKDAANSGRKRY